MSRKNTESKLGYIVIDDTGALALGYSRVLWKGRVATIFSKRSEARNAINRSRSFAKRNSYRWSDYYAIVPLVSVQEGSTG